MTDYLEKASAAARRAARAGDWPTVQAHAREIISRRRNGAEGYFLLGLAERGARRLAQAERAFTRAIEIDAGRVDAAIELARMYLQSNRYGDAVSLIESIEPKLGDNPSYLDMAGTIFVNVGLPERAWPLYQRANELQPGIGALRGNLAACAVYVGEVDTAKRLYRELLDEFPNHQKYHYELSRLDRAGDDKHIEQMKAVLDAPGRQAENNIFLGYALGKEYEDLERWDDAFRWYQAAGDEARALAQYDVRSDIDVIDKVIATCTSGWLEDGEPVTRVRYPTKIPIFVVGLPRTGTTLTERILSSHSNIESAGESFLLQTTIKRQSGVRTNEPMTPTVIEAAARKDMARVADGYIESVAFKFGDKPMFIEKLPENFFYLGFIAKAFPDARIIHLNRAPMDACFALYKQSFFRYAYSLDDLGRFYVAFARLRDHWRGVLGDRLVEVDYEALVSDQEGTTRELLDRIGVEFESACLDFEKNRAASNTASTVQIREKIHSRSVGRWRHFETHLQPLIDQLQEAGIDIER